MRVHTCPRCHRDKFVPLGDFGSRPGWRCTHCQRAFLHIKSTDTLIKFPTDCNLENDKGLTMCTWDDEQGEEVPRLIKDSLLDLMVTS